MLYRLKYKKINRFTKVLLLVLLLNIFPTSASEYSSSNNQAEDQAALETLKRITFWTWEEEVSLLLQNYNNIDYLKINANYVLMNLTCIVGGRK